MKKTKSRKQELVPKQTTLVYLLNFLLRAVRDGGQSTCSAVGSQLPHILAVRPQRGYTASFSLNLLTYHSQVKFQYIAPNSASDKVSVSVALILIFIQNLVSYTVSPCAPFPFLFFPFLSTPFLWTARESRRNMGCDFIQIQIKFSDMPIVLRQQANSFILSALQFVKV